MTNRSTTVAKKFIQKPTASTSKTFIYDDFYYNQRSNNQGLPNMGNTCFLNSAIQFLYSSQLFRQAAIQMKISRPNSLEYNIAKIFECIKYERPYNQKREILESIVEDLRYKNVDYEKYSQQDCYQFVMLILDNISQNYPKLLEFFSLYYKYKCQNCSRAIKRKDYILFNETIQCEKCSGTMNICYISVPKCIITLTNINQNIMKINTVQSQQIKYKLVAKVIYTGNGRHGHYKVSRRKDDREISKFFTFSDSSILEQRSSFNNTFYQKVLLSFYEIDMQDDHIKKQVFLPIQTQQINKQLSRVTQFAKQTSLQSNQIKIKGQGFTKAAKKQCQSYDFNFLVKNVGTNALKEVIEAYSRIGSLNNLIKKQSYTQSPLVKSTKTILSQLDYLQYSSAIKIIAEQIQLIEKYLTTQYNNDMNPLIYYLLEIFPFNQFGTKIAQNLKIILFITFTHMFIQQIPQIHDSFKFSFKYDCHYCRNQKKNRFSAFFMTNNSYFCCNRPISFSYLQIIDKPTYMIYLDDKISQQYTFYKSEASYVLEYSLKSSVLITHGINFRIYEENIYKFEIKPPDQYAYMQFYKGPNTRIRDILKEKQMQKTVQKYLEKTKNKITINQIEYKMDYFSLEDKQILSLRKQQTKESQYRKPKCWEKFVIYITKIN